MLYSQYLGTVLSIHHQMILDVKMLFFYDLLLVLGCLDLLLDLLRSVEILSIDRSLLFCLKVLQSFVARRTRLLSGPAHIGPSERHFEGPC